MKINNICMLREEDYKYIESKGISLTTLEKQLESFATGFPPLLLDRPATAGDGIIRAEGDALKDYVDFYENNLKGKKIIKFVPASGAATRMFKDLFAWIERLRGGADLSVFFNSNPDAKMFFHRMKEFAFWEDLKMVMYKDCLDSDHLLEDENYLPLLEYLISYGGLSYSTLPKGLLKFHRYEGGDRTAMEEHLSEGAAYALQDDGRVFIHFTVSPEHEKKFMDLFNSVQQKYESNLGVTYQLSFSVQKPSTDTVAVDLKNQPFRDRKNTLMFRPGGHGALIENLNDLDGDVIFIKNIDNVVPDRLKEDTIVYKKVLAGVLLKLQQQVHKWLHRLDEGELPQDAYGQAVEFACDHLNIDKAAFSDHAETGSRQLRELLNRPIRVCGMVKNEGEPGGGPFWVRDPESGLKSLQIVESSQINMKDSSQSALLLQATHFNPVDLVCAIRDYKGAKFHLPDFVDPNTGFISRKSTNGTSLKALELPGLWNGAMAHWITVFAEVPLSTFNPVKTINDLLRPEHL